MNYKGTVVLEGGANRGVFTAGVLDFLMEKDIYFSNIIGVSAGSCNGVNYASHQRGRSKNSIIIDKKENKYINKNKIISNNILDMDKLFVTFPQETFPFDYSSFIKNGHDVDIAVTNCISGECEYLKLDAENKNLESCRASCSMPLAAPIVNLNSIAYIDGSVSNSIPLERAYEIGNKIIILVLTQKKGYIKKGNNLIAEKLVKRQYKNYPKAIESYMQRPQRYNKRLNEISELERMNSIFVIRPEVDTISHLEEDVSVLTDFYKHGYELMNRRYAELQTYIQKKIILENSKN